MSEWGDTAALMRDLDATRCKRADLLERLAYLVRTRGVIGALSRVAITAAPGSRERVTINKEA